MLIETVVEPLRATDGFCGPKHNNATCLGTDFQCCNANTFKCGQSEYVNLQPKNAPLILIFFQGRLRRWYML